MRNSMASPEGGGRTGADEAVFDLRGQTPSLPGLSISKLKSWQHLWIAINQEWAHARKISSVWNLTGKKRLGSFRGRWDLGWLQCLCLCSLSWLTLARQARRDVVSNGFSITWEPWAWSRAGCTPQPTTPRSGSLRQVPPHLLLHVLNQQLCFLCRLEKRITKEELYLQAQGTLALWKLNITWK